MPPDNSNRKRIALALIGFVVSVLLVFWLVSALRTAGRVEVEISVFPTDASLTIDGAPAKPGKIVLNKGEHVLKVTRQYFTETTKTINTRTLDTETIYMIAEPDSQAANAYLDEHPEEQRVLERARGVQFTATQDSIADRYPILSKLPYETTEYRIDYTVEQNEIISLQITLYPSLNPHQGGYGGQLQDYKAKALQFLQGNDIDTSKANISYSPDPDKPSSSSETQYPSE